uniref:Uncharacterized protein n=1 Tax=Salix viminalis TaxID=40686 RepID=A0A6N2LMA4_SALVM
MEGNLNRFQVGQLPTVIYMPNFITQTEETHLLQKIYEAPLSKWKSLKNRRLQNWGMLDFYLFFSLPFSQLPPPCKLHTEDVVEEMMHRVVSSTKKDFYPKTCLPG